MEKIRRERMSREREIPPGVEEQNSVAETVYDACVETWQDDVRCAVSNDCDLLHSWCFPRKEYVM